MSVPVQKWRDFLEQTLARVDTELLRYKNDEPSTDTVLTDIKNSELLSELQIMPCLTLRTVQLLAAFIGRDTSPQLQVRFSRTARAAATRGGRLRLSHIAFVLAYMYTFCSGLWLERLASQAAYAQVSVDDSDLGPFALHGADMVFALDAGVDDDDRNCVVSIKRAQGALHMLVITFFQLAKPLYSNSDPTPAESRPRATRYVFDTRIGSDTAPPPVALNAYLDEPVSDATDSSSYSSRQASADSVSLADVYYELARVLYEEWRDGDELPNNTDTIRRADLRAAQAVAIEAPRGAWFCLTLEWLAFPDVMTYMRESSFFGSEVALAREEIAPRFQLRVNPESLDANLRISLHSSAQKTLADRGLSSAAVYAWTSMLINVFWLPLAKFDVKLLLAEQDEPRVAYFDSPADALVRSRQSESIDVVLSSQPNTSPTQVTSDSDDEAVDPPAKQMRTKIKVQLPN